MVKRSIEKHSDFDFIVFQKQRREKL